MSLAETDEIRYIEQQNSLIDAGQLSGAHKIELETVLIGNGWYDPIIQYAAYYNFTVSPGNTYDVTFNSPKVIKQMYNGMYGEGNCLDMSKQCRQTGRDDVCSAADSFCADEVEEVYDHYLKRNEYDIRELNPDPFPYGFYSAYLNTPKVQQAVGAFVNFSGYSDVVGSLAFGNTGDDDRRMGTVKACQALIEQGVYLVQYNGDAVRIFIDNRATRAMWLPRAASFDPSPHVAYPYPCLRHLLTEPISFRTTTVSKPDHHELATLTYIGNWLGNEAVVEEISPPDWTSAGYQNISTSDDIVHGQVKQSASFAFARIYESGHEVPFYQPLVSLQMLERAITGYDIATGTTKIAKGCSYRSSGPAKSTYREGGATVQHKILPHDATYNTTTNGPNPPSGKEKRSLNLEARQGRRTFRPFYRKRG